MITKKFVNGKELVTSCTIANCCLTFKKLDNGEVELTNEKGQKLICSRDELIEVANYVKKEVPVF